MGATGHEPSGYPLPIVTERPRRAEPAPEPGVAAVRAGRAAPRARTLTLPVPRDRPPTARHGTARRMTLASSTFGPSRFGGPRTGVPVC